MAEGERVNVCVCLPQHVCVRVLCLCWHYGLFELVRVAGCHLSARRMTVPAAACYIPLQDNFVDLATSQLRTILLHLVCGQ